MWHRFCNEKWVVEEKWNIRARKRNKNHNNWKYPLYIYHNFVEQHNILFVTASRIHLKIKSFSSTIQKNPYSFLFFYIDPENTFFVMTVSVCCTKKKFLYHFTLMDQAYTFFFSCLAITFMKDFIILNMEMNILFLFSFLSVSFKKHFKIHFLVE